MRVAPAPVVVLLAFHSGRCQTLRPAPDLPEDRDPPDAIGDSLRSLEVFVRRPHDSASHPAVRVEKPWSEEGHCHDEDRHPEDPGFSVATEHGCRDQHRRADEEDRLPVDRWTLRMLHDSIFGRCLGAHNARCLPGGTSADRQFRAYPSPPDQNQSPRTPPVRASTGMALVPKPSGRKQAFFGPRHCARACLIRTNQTSRWLMIRAFPRR